MGAYKNLTGKRFNQLTVLKYEGRRGDGHNSYWLCKCDCGNKTSVDSYSIQTGHTKSCGCLIRISCRQGHLPGESGLKRAFYLYKSSAKNRKRNFDLTLEEFKELTQQKCFYCGVEPERECKSNPDNPKDTYGNFKYNGIDRVDNLKGYTKENTVPCCTVCNKMKIHYTREFFLDHIMKIATYNKGD